MHPCLCATLIALTIATKTNGLLDSEVQTPDLVVTGSGYGKIVLDVTAGPSGAPHGFTVWWMSESDYLANDARWYSASNSVQREAIFTGIPTFNSWGASDFRLAADETATIEIGDLLDETGVEATWSDELDPGTHYVFTAFANGDRHTARSDRAATLSDQTRLNGTCAFTRRGWESNPQSWPVGGLLLGNVAYSQPQLLSILQHGPTQNGLVVLARQLATAKLNVANGADSAPVGGTIALADATIGFLVVPPVGGDTLSPAIVRDMIQVLDDYNNGVGAGDPCSPTSVRDLSWGSVKSGYR